MSQCDTKHAVTDDFGQLDYRSVLVQSAEGKLQKAMLDLWDIVSMKAKACLERTSGMKQRLPILSTSFLSRKKVDIMEGDAL